MLKESANPTDGKVIPFANDREVIPVWSCWRAFMGLLWSEWYSHSRLLLIFVAVWLGCVWILPLYASPAWILAFGPCFAFIAGPVFGGSDTNEGCEEFILTLPPTRTERYLSRLAVGGGALLLFTAMDMLALGLDLSQTLAKLYVRSGLIEPRPILQSGLLYWLLILAPWAVFACSFVMSALAHTRAILLSSPFWAGLLVLGAVRLGLWYEQSIWEKFNGWLCCPALVVMGAAALWWGMSAYRRKQIGPPTAPIAIPLRLWLWILFSIGAFISALAIAASLARYFAIGAAL